MTTATNGQGHGAAVADLARVEAAAPAAVGQLQPVEGLDRGRVERAALDHVAGAGPLQAGQGQAAPSSGGRVERSRASTARPDTYCAHCGRRMSPGRHGQRRYCSNGCRTGAYKRRRRVEAAAVEGVTDGNHG